MELDFSRVSKSEGIKEEFNITEYLNDNTINFCGERLNIVSPVTVKGSAVNYDGKINVELSITARAGRVCARCLKSFFEEMQSDSVYVFVEETDERKEDYCVYKGEKADITDIVIGEITAGLKMKPLCSDNCKGLCPICGEDQNIKGCQCQKEETDPRMQVLSKLFDRK